MFSLIAANVDRFRSDKKAVTAIEYALIATFIAVAIIAAASALGTSISEQFAKIGTEL